MNRNTRACAHAHLLACSLTQTYICSGMMMLPHTQAGSCWYQRIDTFALVALVVVGAAPLASTASYQVEMLVFSLFL